MRTIDGETSQKGSALRRVLSFKETKITALTKFGYATQNKAELPQIEHFHQDKLEFVVMIHGMQEYITSGKSLMLYSNEMLFSLANEYHSCGEKTSNENEQLWFQLDISTRNNFLDLPDEKASALFDALTHYGLRKTQLSRQIIECFMESFTLLSQKSISAKIKGQALFLYAITQTASSQKTNEAVSDEIGKTKNYVAEHIKEPIVIAELATASGLNPADFKARFATETGMTPREYLYKEKIEKAKLEVAMTDQIIGDIAFEYGFSTCRHFRSVFKQLLGVSPKKYRRNYRNGKTEI